MPATDLAAYRALLADVRRDLEATIATDDARLAAIRSARSDANDDDEHDPEGATLSAEWSRAEGLREGAQRELSEIAEAEQRLLEGRYGVCEGCGRDIPAARLHIRPAARMCVSCASLKTSRTLFRP